MRYLTEISAMEAWIDDYPARVASKQHITF